METEDRIAPNTFESHLQGERLIRARAVGSRHVFPQRRDEPEAGKRSGTALSQIVRIVDAPAASAGAAPAQLTTDVVARISVPSCILPAMAASLQLPTGRSVRVRAERTGSGTALSQTVGLVEAAAAPTTARGER